MTAKTARAFWIVAPGIGEIRDEVLAVPTSDAVVVRADYSGISRGTEALVFEGRVPSTEYDRMRAPFQAGAFPAPVKYGYSSVGVVEEGPAPLHGRRVFVLYPHQTRFVVPAAAAFVLPENVPSSRAVLAANLETALNGLWDGRVSPGDRVVVVGAGTIGCLVAWLAGRTPGCAVELVDVNPSRGSVAAALGVAFSTPKPATTDADVVFHCSGSSDGLAGALRVAGFEATIVEMSWYGDRLVAAPLGEAFHSRRLTIVSSQVGWTAAAKRPRWDNRRRLQLAISLLADPVLDILISGESGFEELPRLMPRLAASPDGHLCHRIVYV